MRVAALVSLCPCVCAFGVSVRRCQGKEGGETDGPSEDDGGISESLLRQVSRTNNWRVRQGAGRRTARNGWNPGKPPMESTGTVEMKTLLDGRFLQQEF